MTSPDAYLESEFNAFAMYDAGRAKVEAALTLPDSNARTERGASD